MPGVIKWSCYPRDWFSGTRTLSLAAKGVYFDLLNVMYDTGKPVPYDLGHLCRVLGCRERRTVTGPMAELVGAGKLKVIETGDGWAISNDRFEREMQASEARAKARKAKKALSSQTQGDRIKQNQTVSLSENAEPAQNEFANFEPTQGVSIEQNQTLNSNLACARAVFNSKERKKVSKKEDPPLVPPKGAKRSAQFPASWSKGIPDAQIEQARKKGHGETVIAREWVAFENHHKAKGSTFKSWPHAWATWVGNINRYSNGGSNGRHNPNRPSTDERRNRLMDASSGELAAGQPSPRRAGRAP